MYTAFWEAISPKSFLFDGSSAGEVYLVSTAGFKTNMKVIIEAIGLPDLRLIVKFVRADDLLIVGPDDKNTSSVTDLTLYTVAVNATIKADQQYRDVVSLATMDRFTYEEEPTVAQRNILVSEFGNKLTATEYAPKLGLDVNILGGTITVMPKVEVEISAYGVDYDSIRLSDGNEEVAVSPASQLSIYGGNLIYNIDKTTTANMVYIGMAAPGSLEANAVWKIMRIDKTTSPVRIRMADANENFDNIWNNRIGLSYS